jgi:hypothetical protein
MGMKLKDLPDSLDLGKIHTEAVEENRPVDRELPLAMSVQRLWLELPSVVKRRNSLGWDASIHGNSRVTYRQVRDVPCYNWQRWMKEQLEREGAE